jgi:hypothetical protein
MNLRRYDAIIWLETVHIRGILPRTHCAVAVGLRRGECGDTSGMAYTDLTIRIDDPARHQTALPEAERVLADAGWRRTGDWKWNGSTLQAPAKRG